MTSLQQQGVLGQLVEIKALELSANLSIVVWLYMPWQINCTQGTAYPEVFHLREGMSRGSWPLNDENCSETMSVLLDQ